MGRAFEFRKARKMKRWSAMSKTFTRIGKDISITVKEGGSDPDTNSRLRQIIQNAKAKIDKLKQEAIKKVKYETLSKRTLKDQAFAEKTKREGEAEKANAARRRKDVHLKELN